MGTPRFQRWLELESLKEKLIKAVREGTDFPQVLFQYLSTALSVNSKYYEQADWFRIVELFYVILSKSPKIDLPMTSPTDDKHKEEAWNYPERIWYLYAHMIAKAYGWDLERISYLRVNDALAMIQEILTDEQLDREFYYGLSEVAYSYDKRSKKSKYNPMPRPHWMRPKIQPVPRFPIPAYMLPVGNVDMKAIPDELYPKEIIH
jgi:hypothetical protein